MRIDSAQAMPMLTRLLIGAEVHRFCFGDTVEIGLSNELWLLAHEVHSDETAALDKLLSKASPSVLDGIDPELVSRAVVLASSFRRPIAKVEIDKDAELSLTFEGARHITIPTNVDIVDWQWSISKSNDIPYRVPFKIACLAPGVIEAPDPD